MEKVLRESNDGIVVYIAPTKALVTQIAAEVYARFSKKVPNGIPFHIHYLFVVHVVFRDFMGGSYTGLSYQRAAQLPDSYHRA